MKALMVNSTRGRVIPQKMRDERYMRHLREVEKINNREAEQLSKDLHEYNSITQLHQRHKLHANQHHSQLQHQLLHHKNQQINTKIKQIKSYLPERHSTTHDTPEPTHTNQRYSLHYHYRKRKQQQIDIDNQKLSQAILSQRSTYLPKIRTNNHSPNIHTHSPRGGTSPSRTNLPE